MGIMRTMRWILVGAALVSAAAVAQGKVRRGALGSAKEDDAPAPAAPAPRAGGRDVALLRGIMWAFEPSPVEIRTRAIEDLGLLGDPRALNALAQLAMDPNQSYAKAAVRAIALIPNPRAEEILCNVVRHPTLPEGLKVQALELVPFQATVTSGRFVRAVANAQQGYAYTLQSVAKRLEGELPFAPGAAP